jgi:hypothetical protein
MSCNEKNIRNNDIIVVDSSKAKPGFLSEIVDSISYIKLETSDSCLIGYINRIKYYDKHYYIYDHRAKTIYIFDETGKFVKKFNKYGQGPEEYLWVNSFANDNDGLLHIHDQESAKILIYDTAGNFVSKVNTNRKDYPRDFICLGDKYMLYMPDKNIGARQGAFIFNPQTNTYTEIMHIDEWNNKAISMLDSYIIEKKGMEYSLIDNYSSIIYNMKGNEIINKFQFNIKPRYNPKSDQGYLFAWGNETDNIINIFWGYKDGNSSDHVITCFYAKHTKTLKIFRGIKNDIDGIDGVPWTLNNRIVLTVTGETDETGFELNPWIQIWHLKNVNEMP